MEELPVEDPAHMATAERQLHDWESYIVGKKLTDDSSAGHVCSLPPSLSRASLPLPQRKMLSGRGLIHCR